MLTVILRACVLVRAPGMLCAPFSAPSASGSVTTSPWPLLLLSVRNGWLCSRSTSCRSARTV